MENVFILNHENKFTISFSEEFYCLIIKKIAVQPTSGRTGPEFMGRVFQSNPRLKWHANKKNGGIFDDVISITPFLPVEIKDTKKVEKWGEIIFKNGLAVPDRNPKKIYMDLELSISWIGNIDKDIQIQIEYE